MPFTHLKQLATYLFLLFVPRALAQDPVCSLVLSGRVVDAHDRTPLGFASVVIIGTAQGVACDAEGTFRLEGICPGAVEIEVTHIGCDPLRRTLRLDADLEIELKLEHHKEELQEFEVLRERPDENVGHARQEVDREGMERASGRTLAEMLGSVTGVTTLSSGPTISKPVIHGLGGNRVLILNQGIRQEDQQWGTEHAPNLDPLSSDRLTVVKGAAGVQYGSDAIGGVVITEPVELPREAGIGGEMRGLGVLNGRGGGANALLQGGVKGLGGFGWRVQGSARSFGDSEAPGYVLSNTGVHEAGGSASLGYRNHRWSTSAFYSWFGRELGILRASHIGNLTDLENAIASAQPWYVAPFTYDIQAPRQVVRHQLARAEAGLALSERDRVTFTYGYQSDDRKEYDVRRAERDDTPSLDLDLATHTADMVLNHWLGPHVHGKVGISGLRQENVNVPGTDVRPLLPNYRRESGGVFLLEHFPVNERLELEAGARIEASSLDVAKYTLDNELIRPHHEFLNHAVSAGANWSLRDSLRLRFNLSSAYRPPHVSELYSEGLHHGAAAIEEGDPTLGSERALRGVIDLEGGWSGGRLRTDVTVHAGTINGYIYLRPDGTRLTVRGAFPVFQYVATDALLYGVDAMVRYAFLPHWELRSRAGLVRGRDLVQDEWLFQMPADRWENSLVYAIERDDPHLRSMEVAVSSLLVAEQERIPAGLDYTDPPAAYHLLGLSASIGRALGGGELRLGLRGDNLLNTAYRDYMDRFRYYADASGINITVWATVLFGSRP